MASMPSLPSPSLYEVQGKEQQISDTKSLIPKNKDMPMRFDELLAIGLEHEGKCT
jgi:hypothetical protein